jgi:hypothetical protein
VWERREIHENLVGKPEGKRPFGIRKSRWEDNIKMILRKWQVVDWIRLAEDREQWCALVNTVMNLRVP